MVKYYIKKCNPGHPSYEHGFPWHVYSISDSGESTFCGDYTIYLRARQLLLALRRGAQAVERPRNERGNNWAAPFAPFTNANDVAQFITATAAAATTAATTITYTFQAPEPVAFVPTTFPFRCPVCDNTTCTCY